MDQRDDWPRMRRASWISLGIIVTLFACMAHRFLEIAVDGRQNAELRVRNDIAESHEQLIRGCGGGKTILNLRIFKELYDHGFGGFL